MVGVPQHRGDVRLVGYVYDPCLDCVGSVGSMGK